MFLPEYQFSEILIGRYQRHAPLMGDAQHCFITDSGIELGHVQQLVAVGAQPFNDGTIDTFVREQPHAALFEIG